MYHCLESLLQLEQLPQRTDNILSIAQAKQKYENSWNIYYLLGKLFDSALRFSLSRSPEKSYILAERYYLYACEIDLARRQTGKSVSGFTHMYTALLTLYLRNRKETDFYAAWKRYHSFVTIPESFKTLSQIRWLIIKGAFAEAQVKLREYGRLAERKTQQKQVTALLDIIEVICSGNTKNLRGIYRPFHLRQLEKVRRLTEKKIRKHA